MDKIANYATFIDYGIFGFLIFLCLLVIAIGIERLWFYSIIRLDDYEDKRELELDLHKRLTLIATIGSNAPYIGLLGTVIGIMLTFVSIGANSILDTKGIMSGLAMALRATALGLVVAIPSVVFYNLLLRKAEVILTNWEIFMNPASKNKYNPRLDSHEDKTINKLTKDKRPQPYTYKTAENLQSKIHKTPRIVDIHDNTLTTKYEQTNSLSSDSQYSSIDKTSLQDHTDEQTENSNINASALSDKHEIMKKISHHINANDIPNDIDSKINSIIKEYYDDKLKYTPKG